MDQPARAPTPGSWHSPRSRVAAATVPYGLLAVAFAVAAIGGPDAFLAATLERGPWLDLPGPGPWSLPTFLALASPWFCANSNLQVSQRPFILRDMAAMRLTILRMLGFGLIFTLVPVVWSFASVHLALELEIPALGTPGLLASGAIPPRSPSSSWWAFTPPRSPPSTPLRSPWAHRDGARRSLHRLVGDPAGAHRGPARRLLSGRPPHRRPRHRRPDDLSDGRRTRGLRPRNRCLRPRLAYGVAAVAPASSLA